MYPAIAIQTPVTTAIVLKVLMEPMIVNAIRGIADLNVKV